jgi:hypothetical protein
MLHPVKAVVLYQCMRKAMRGAFACSSLLTTPQQSARCEK